MSCSKSWKLSWENLDKCWHVDRVTNYVQCLFEIDFLGCLAPHPCQAIELPFALCISSDTDKENFYENQELFLGGDHYLYSCDLLCDLGEIGRRNKMLVILKG